MKVRDLIEKLSAMDPELDVVVNREGDCRDLLDDDITVRACESEDEEGNMVDREEAAVITTWQ